MNFLAIAPNENKAGSLFLYESACAAIAQALTVDEILEIKSRAEAIRAYAKQASNRELEIQATEIRIRALRRLGQLLNAIKIDGQIEPVDTANKKEMKQRKWKRLLASQQIGVNQNLAIKAIKAAALSDEQYDNLIVGWRKRCIEENKIYLTIEPRITPERNDWPRNEQIERPATLFDTYVLANDPVGDYPLGDLVISRIDEYITELGNDWADSEENYACSMRLLHIIQNHFGGGIMPRRDGTPVELRDVLSESRLAEFIEAATAEQKRT